MSACAAVSVPDNSTHDLPTAHPGQLRGILYVNPLPGDPLWDGYGKCIATAAAAHGAHFSTIGPSGGDANAPAMEDELSQAIADRTQAIVTWAGISPGAFGTLFVRERRQGGVVVTLLSSGETPGANADVGFSSQEVTEVDLEAIAALPGVHRIGLLDQVQGDHDDQEVKATLKTELTRHRNLKFVAAAYDNGIFGNDADVTTSLLLRNPTINFVLPYNSFPGVDTAIRELGKAGQVFTIGGTDHRSTALAEIRHGTAALVNIVQICPAGLAAVNALYQAWNGRPGYWHVSTPPRVVTPKTYLRLVAQGAG